MKSATETMIIVVVLACIVGMIARDLKNQQPEPAARIFKVTTATGKPVAKLLVSSNGQVGYEIQQGYVFSYPAEAYPISEKSK